MNLTLHHRDHPHHRPPEALPVGATLPYAGPIFGTDGTPNPQLEALLASQGWLPCDGRALDRAYGGVVHRRSRPSPDRRGSYEKARCQAAL